MSAEQSNQRVQRVRIGLTGLAFVFLLVLLGAAISRWSGPANPPQPTPANSEQPNEPLAEIGVAPGQSAMDNAEQPNTAAAP